MQREYPEKKKWKNSARTVVARVAAAAATALLLAATAATCSSTTDETVEAARQSVNFCGGEYCVGTEVCCALTNGSTCLSADECCVARGRTVCGRACLDTKSDPNNCGGCGVKCQGVCSNSACVPVSVESWQRPLPAMDLNVSVSDRFVMTGEYDDFEVLDILGFLSNVTPQTQLAPSTVPSSADPSGQISVPGAWNLFRNFLFDDTPENLNKTLFPSDAVVKCNWNDAVAVPKPTPPGIVLESFAWWPSGSCIDEVYDMHTTYDAARQRFWIIGQARNTVARNGCNVAQSTNTDLCTKFNALAVRYQFVAVSKTNDPRAGFWKYLVSKDYVDQPWLAVNNDYVMTYHANGGPLHLFDANAMANGTLSSTAPAELKAAGKVLDANVDFKGAHLQVAKHHEGASTTTFIASTSGTSDLWIYALTSPHPAGGAPTLLGPAHYVDPSGRSMSTADVAYSNGYLYVVNATPEGAVAVWRVPVSQSSVTSKTEIPSGNVSTWSLVTANEKADYPTIDVTVSQDVVVGWRSSDVATKPTVARTAFLYNGEAAFRPSRVLWALTGTSGSAPRIDFVSSQRDPWDKDVVWTALADESGFLLSRLKPR